MRRMRVLAWPRRPRNSRSCLERMPLTICGMTRVAIADDAGEELFAGLELARSGCGAARP